MKYSMRAMLSVILDLWARILNCPTNSSAVPVCRMALNLALASLAMSAMRKASSSFFLKAAQVPKAMAPVVAWVFDKTKASFHALAGPLFMNDRAKTIFLSSWS